MATISDLFSATHTDIAGIARAGDAELTFTKGETTYTLAAMNVQVAYSEKIAPIILPGGKVLIFAQMSMGTVSIGALLGNGLEAFLTYFGDLCNIDDDDNKLEVKMTSGMSCDSEQALDVSEEVQFDCYNSKITDFGASNQIQGIVISTNMTLFTLNVDITISADA